jgi:hypothetical protein
MWQPIRAPVLDLHSHDPAYAAVVVAGNYEEAGIRAGSESKQAVYCYTIALKLT